MAESSRDWEGDWIGSCRVCWNVRNLGVGWQPPKTIEYAARCNRKNPDGSICQGKMLISLTPAANKRVNAARRQKKAQEYNRGK